MGIQDMGRDERQSPIYLQSRINVREPGEIEYIHSLEGEVS